MLSGTDRARLYSRACVRRTDSIRQPGVKRIAALDLAFLLVILGTASADLPELVCRPRIDTTPNDN